MTKHIRKLSINQAAQEGIKRLRLPQWSNPRDYILIRTIGKHPAPWLYMYSEMNKPIHGHNPLRFWSFRADLNSKVWVIYDGPVSPDEKEN